MEKYVGKSKTDKNKVARMDEGLIAAAATDEGHDVRDRVPPSKLKDAADLTRLKGILAIEVSENYGEDGEFVPLALLFNSPGMAKAGQRRSRRNDLPEDAWPQNPEHHRSKTVAGCREASTS